MKKFADYLFEMSNYYSIRTGLPGTIYVSTRFDNKKKLGHMIAKLKLSSGKILNFVFDDNDGRIVKSSKEISASNKNKVQEWIKLNLVILKQLWNEEIDSIDFGNMIKSVA